MIQPTGSSRNGAISSAARRTSHLKRIVPANGSWTPIVAVNSGHTRANSARICRRDGRSMPRLIRLRLRYGSLSSQHHGAITAAGVYHGPVKNLEIARLFHEMAGVLEVQSGSVFRVRAYQRAAQTLEALAESGEILRVPGIREKTRANILRGIALWKAGRARTPLPRARAVAARVTEALAARGGADRIEVAGSLRRLRETGKDIDILVTSTEPQRVIKTFVTLPSVLEIVAKGDTKASVRHQEGLQIDLRVVEPDAFGAALQYFTGSKDHNVRIRELARRQALSVSEYGVFDEKTGARVAGTTEQDVYGALGLPWIPPELRENAGEIEAALLAQIAKIRELQPRYRIRILAGSECDVLADGTLDFPDEILRELDVVLAAVHSRFTQPRHEMTTRLVRALKNPYVNVLAHPTGRLIGAREPYDVDLDAVLEAACAHGKAVEINASPERLDLNDAHARRAAELGVSVAISSDTHWLANLDNLELGLGIARRAWIGPTQVVNVLPLAELLAWAHRRRPGARE